VTYEADSAETESGNKKQGLNGFTLSQYLSVPIVTGTFPSHITSCESTSTVDDDEDVNDDNDADMLVMVAALELRQVL
jgi:hypothetical protein